jgi:hypothetical protein
LQHALRRVQALSNAPAYQLARAFAFFFELINLAKTNHRKRRRLSSQPYPLRRPNHHHPCLAQTGLLGMIGNTERGPEAIAAIREFHSVYLIAVGGAAYLISKAIHSARVLAFAGLGMEAIYEFDVVDMPVAVDSAGSSVHTTDPRRMAVPHRPAPPQHRHFAVKAARRVQFRLHRVP